MSRSPRAATAALQSELAYRQLEMSTGRHHDIGLELGAKTGRDIGLRVQLGLLDQRSVLVADARARADLTQSSLKGISEIASNFLEALTGARGALLGQQIARDAARSALESMTDILNVSYAGSYLFGGINSQTPPIQTYSGGLAEEAVASSFASTFGISQSDEAVGLITPDAMSEFLEGSFADLFSPDNWRDSWSSASSANVLVQLSEANAIDASSNANNSFVSSLAQAFTMVIDLGQENLNQASFEVIVDRAMALVGQAQLETSSEQSRVGIAQQRLSSVSLDYDTRRAAFTKAIDELESVDSYEVATRINVLMTQLEASYTLTGRLNQMSLLSYI